MLFQNNNFLASIPTYISIYGLISAQIFIVGLFISCYYKHYYGAIILFFLYITTIIYWSKLHHFSVIKCIDSFLAVSILGLITFYYSPKYFKPLYKSIWNWFMFIIVIIFIISNYIYYAKCFNRDNTTSNFHIYPLVYTSENSKEREIENYRSVFTHCIFIHIMPVLVYFFCCYNSIY
jgi:hypothetical protein